MKAVALYQYLPVDATEALVDVTLPTPAAAGRDLLVRVEAISVNPVDTKVRAPKDKIETVPRVLGWDAAGVVEAVGPEVTLFRPGDAVYYAGSITRPGANAQYHLVDERIVARKPASLDYAAAAALPLTTLTAWEALFDRLGISVEGNDAGAALLIVGAAGGVGSMAIQLAKRLGHLKVIATASRPESVRWCQRLGADAVIDHFGDMAAQLKALDIHAVPFLLILNDSDRHFPAAARIVAPQGKICSIVENRRPLPVEALKAKSATFVWEFMFTRAMFETDDMIEQHRILSRVAGLIDDDVIRGTMAEHLGPINAANVLMAHRRLEAGRTIGKLVLSGFA